MALYDGGGGLRLAVGGYRVSLDTTVSYEGGGAASGAP